MTKTTSKRTPTIGERIAADMDFGWGYTGETAKMMERRIARRINAAIKREVDKVKRGKR